MDTGAEGFRPIPSVEKAPDKVQQIVSNLKEPKLLEALSGPSPENRPHHQAAAEKLTGAYLGEIPPEQRATAYSEVLTETPSAFIMSEVVKVVGKQPDLQTNEQLLQAIGSATERLVISRPSDTLQALATLAKTNPAFVIEEAGRIATLQRDESKPDGKWKNAGMWLDENIKAVSAAVRNLPEAQQAEAPAQVEAIFATLAEVQQDSSQAGYTARALGTFLRENPTFAASTRALLERIVAMKDVVIEANKANKPTFDSLSATLNTLTPSSSATSPTPTV